MENRYDKLGLVVENTYKGLDTLMTLNTDQRWEKYLGEIAEIREIDKGDKKNWSIKVLQRIECGIILRTICPNSGRNAYTSASIFVPWDICVSGQELSDIIIQTEDELWQWKKESSPEKLRALFNRQYKAVDLLESSVQTAADGIAYRYYGEYYSLTELLEDPYQSYYNAYEYVFLIDKESGISCKIGDDLTRKELKKSVIVNPPQKDHGFEPYIEDCRFTKSIRVTVGYLLTVLWKRDGYKTISKEIIIKVAGNDIPVPQPNEYEVQRRPYSVIHVYDQSGNQIDAACYKLIINGKSIHPDESVFVSESDLDNIRVIVEPEDSEMYKPQETTIDLRDDKRKKIYLDKVRHEYTFMLPLAEGGYEKITCSSEKKLKACPFKGFKLKNGRIPAKGVVNRLECVIWTKKRIIAILIYSVILLSLGICAGWYVAGYLNDDKGADYKENNQLGTYVTDNVKKPKSENEVRKTEDNWTDIINYLDGNNVWNKDEMDKFPEIKGLWDALNERRFDDILEYEDRLEKSQAFNDIVYAIRKNRHKQFIGTFNERPDDYDITIRQEGNKKGYIKALEDALNSSADDKKEQNVPNNKKVPTEEIVEENTQSNQNEW